MMLSEGKVVEMLVDIAGRIDYLLVDFERTGEINYPEADFLIGQAVALAIVTGHEEQADQMVMMREGMERG